MKKKALAILACVIGLICGLVTALSGDPDGSPAAAPVKDAGPSDAGALAARKPIPHVEAGVPSVSDGKAPEAEKADEKAPENQAPKSAESAKAK